jgi:hypothetical protein
MSSEFGPTLESAIEAVSAELRAISLQVWLLLLSLSLLICQVHSNPELSHEEFKAHDLITDYLETKGFFVTRKACGLNTAFVAEYKVGSGDACTIGFLSEYATF